MPRGGTREPHSCRDMGGSARRGKADTSRLQGSLGHERTQSGSVPKRDQLTPRTVPWRIAVLWLVVVPMLFFGLIDDVVDLVRERPPLPDRLMTSLEVFEGWQRRHPLLAALPAWVDAATSLLLTASGAALLLGARRRPEFIPAALVVGLAVLDETDYVPLPDLAVTIYWKAYWLVLLAAMVRFASQFPARLDPSVFQANARVRARHWLVAILGDVWQRARTCLARLFLHPTATWTVALSMALAYAAVFDVYGHPLPGRPRGLVLTVGLLLLVTMVGLSLLAIRYFIAGYRQATPSRRRRALWLVQACVVYLSGLVVLISLTLAGGGLVLRETALFQLLLALLYLALVLASALFLAAAIYYRGAVNPALVIKRTFLVMTLSAMAFPVYRFLESYVEEIASQRLAEMLGWPASAVSGAIGATVLALILIPVGGRLSRAIEPLVQKLTRSLKSSLFLVRAGVSVPSSPVDDLATRRRIMQHVRHLRQAAARLGDTYPEGRMRTTGDGVLFESRSLDAALTIAFALIGASDAAVAEDQSSRVRVALHRADVEREATRDDRAGDLRALSAVYASAADNEVVASSTVLEFAPDGAIQRLEECPVTGAGLPPDLRAFRVARR